MAPPNGLIFPPKFLVCPDLVEYLKYMQSCNFACGVIPERAPFCRILGKLGKRKKANRKAKCIHKLGKWAM